MTTFRRADALDVEDRDRFRDALERIAPGCRTPLVAHVAVEIVEIGDDLGEIPVVDLLRAVDLVAGRHAGDVEVSDPAARLADSAREIAIHDLQVIDIADELDVRRIDALADRDAPVPVPEDLILPPEAGIGQPVVHVLDRERDAARLEMTLDPAET